MNNPVLTKDASCVRTITLNRPNKRNAIDMELRIALIEAIDAASVDPCVRAIILTGAGSAFCAGGDVASMQRMPADRAQPRADLAKRVIASIWRTPKPIIAAVEGPAIGAGAALAAACDRVVAARDARFAFTFTNVGLCGDMGTFVSLPARVGPARARQMLMLPEPLAATDALHIGLVDAVTDIDGALAKAEADAQRLASGPATALGIIKLMIAETSSTVPFEMLEREAAYQAKLFDTDDFAEGVAAFHGKRRPVFVSAHTDLDG
ncbi:enoyl-CoA hydratase [Mycolicibacterium mucogenicum]|uniref:Enoyl-CoA hydratase n=1 Tax=Mycolicibacterium mucogenicum TaxID=56689 RepID=A0A1A3HFJ6_MYCMU|nr:enoyl-CoA hydratase-related protein [Mycolicibacterium mucogenicum]OBJ46459.1 enoyl-CoA hydratase [Mycolicibacterium mucogenicum]